MALNISYLFGCWFASGLHIIISSGFLIGLEWFFLLVVTKS